MAGNVRSLIRTDIETPDGVYTLTLRAEDLSSLYPGMVRYLLHLTKGDEVVGTFLTNTYEYSPTVPLDAETAALQKAAAWERELRENRERFLSVVGKRMPRRPFALEPADVVVVQGSPRADGNCSIMAGWVVEAAEAAGKTARVVYPDDLDIHPCIGCYRCYNTGTCTFDDEMGDLIHLIVHASLLVVCSPVYTNTVPGGLKILIDRCQALHAARTLGARRAMPAGLLLAVCGREGRSNFACLTPVMEAFMGNLGIRSAGAVLADGIDRVRDVRLVEGVEDQVKERVRSCLLPSRP
ncbi:MAG TPA: flavodoxin family protein [Methanofollis liminatans]|uniref:Flavodoxin family protein n=1 Tax=Methanofollis liminatans TaxID=2201 RepID=A0A831M2K0_9EURY|nr:flavodoxin family protein [Methanofollis liminatans]